MSDQPTEVTFDKLADAIKFVEDRGKAASASAQAFTKAFQELTDGYQPGQNVNALDVVKICLSIYGEPKADD